MNVVEGSAEHLPLVEKEKANWAKNAKEKAAKFAKGEGNLQLAAMTELKKRGIECDDAMKANGILEAAKCAKGEGTLQLAAITELKKRGIKCDNATKAQSIMHSDKFAKGEGSFQLAAMTELKKRGIKCDNTTKVQSMLTSHQMGALSIAYKAWMDDQVTQLLNLCKSGHSIPKIVDRLGISIVRVRGRIRDMRIEVLSRGKWKLITKC